MSLSEAEEGDPESRLVLKVRLSTPPGARGREHPVPGWGASGRGAEQGRSSSWALKITLGFLFVRAVLGSLQN